MAGIFRFDNDPDGQRLAPEMVGWPPLDEFERERDEVEPEDDQNFDRNESIYDRSERRAETWTREDGSERGRR